MSCNGCEPFELLVGLGDPTTPPDACQNYPFYFDAANRNWWVWTDNGWQVVLSPIRWMSEAYNCTLDEGMYISINAGGTPGDWDSGDYQVTTLKCLLHWIVAHLLFENVGQGVGIFDGFDMTTDPWTIRLRSVNGVEGVETRLGADTDTVEVRFNPPTMTDQQEIELAQQLAGNVTAMQILAAAMQLGWIGDVDISSPQAKQVLAYNASTTHWFNSFPALNWNSDVTLTNPQLHEGLFFDGSQWVNTLPYLNWNADATINAPVLHQGLFFDGSQWVNTLPELDWNSDVTLTNPQNHQGLFHNGTEWVNTLPELDWNSDVTLTNPQVNQGLFHNGTEWVNTLPALPWNSDVTITNPQDGEVLTYDGSTNQWVNEPLPPSGQALVMAYCQSESGRPAGIQPGEYWLDLDPTPKVLYQYNGTGDVAIQPGAAPSSIVYAVCRCQSTFKAWKFCDGDWFPAALDEGSVREYANEVQVAYVAASEADALAQGMGDGDFWLNTSFTPPVLYRYSSAGGSNPAAGIDFVNNDAGTQAWVRNLSGDLVPLALGGTAPNETQVAICAGSESDALAAGLQANEYWMDTSASPPVLMFYDGSSSSQVAAGDRPEFVFCLNTGGVYAYRSGQYNLMPSGGLSVRTQGVVLAYCAADEASAISDGMPANFYWLDGDASPMQLYWYDGNSSTAVPDNEAPAVVFCCNNQCIYTRCGSSSQYTFFPPSSTPCTYGGLPPNGQWTSAWATDSEVSRSYSSGVDIVAYRRHDDKVDLEIGGSFGDIQAGDVIEGYRISLRNDTNVDVIVEDICFGWKQSSNPHYFDTAHLLPKPTFNNASLSLPFTLAAGQTVNSDDMVYHLDDPVNEANFLGLTVGVTVRRPTGQSDFKVSMFSIGGSNSLQEKTASPPTDACANESGFAAIGGGFEPYAPLIRAFEWYYIDN